MRRTAPLLVLLVLAAAAASATAAAAASSSGRPRKALRAIGHAGAGTNLRSAASAASMPAPAVTAAAKPVPVHMATVVRLAPNTKGVNRARTLAAEGEQLGAIMGTVSAVTAATKHSGSRARKAAKRTARVAAASTQEDTEAYNNDEEAALEEQLGQMLTGINLRVAAAEAVVAGYSSDDGSELTEEEQDAEFAQLMADILARVAAVEDVMENAGLATLNTDEERTALERDDDASWSAQEDARRSVFVQHPAAKHQVQEAAEAEQEEEQEEEEEGVADADIVNALQEQQEAGDEAIADEEGEEEERADAAGASDASAADAEDEEAEEQAAQRQVAISAKLELLSHLLAGLSAAAAQR